MAIVATRTWLSEIGNRVGSGLKRSLASETKKNKHHDLRQEQPPTLGILAFETARTMSTLLSLYKSLSEDQVLKLRKVVMRSEGVAFLNSKDEGFLLNLACAERIEDLDRAATVVARLGKKCSDMGLNGFEDVYADLKFGFIDLGKLDFTSKEIEKTIDKMEKLIFATSALYSGLEALAELEISKRKLKRSKNGGSLQSQMLNSDLLDQKFAYQRQLVQHYTEVSLWSQTFNKTVGLLARTVCIVYARICVVFGPYISVLPHVSSRHVRLPTKQVQHHLEKDKNCTRSGPVSKTCKPSLVRFWSRESSPVPLEDIGFGVGFGIGFKENHFYLFGGVGKKNKLWQVAPASTLGGSGLALRYANVIILAERYLNSPCSISDDEREGLYQMLPASLKMSVTSKLKKSWRREEEAGSCGDESLAEGWRDALKGIMGWLAPMAHDTVRWQTERNCERQHFDARPTVLLLQTLHFSDTEKTEAAIAEVLVGLSCIYRYESRRRYSLDSGDGFD